MHFCIMIWLQAFGNQEVECGGSKKIAYKGSGTIGWYEVGVVLLQKVCDCGDKLQCMFGMY